MHCIGQTKIMASDPKMEDNMNKINDKCTMQRIAFYGTETETTTEAHRKEL